MKIITIKTISFLTLLLFFTQLKAQEDCFPKKGNKLVYDNTNTLTPNQVNQLNYKLVNYANSTSTQIVVVIVDDLCGEDPAMYATKLGHKWGVGQGDKDNGAVIMVKPTGGSGQRKVYIATGYGLEGIIPDAIAKRIVENEMIPHFKNGDIYGGIDAAATVIMELASGEYPPEEYVKKSEGSPLPYFFLILFIIFFSFISRIGRTRKYARTNHMSFWMAMMLMNSSMNRHSGHYGNFTSGGGSFGGFGGGGFGGGGAGGSW